MLKKAFQAEEKEWIARGDHARDGRDWIKAAEAYQHALDINSELPAIWVQYGHALKESGSLADAEAAYARSIELAPDIADTHLQLGHLYKTMGRMRQAEQAYARAYRIAPTKTRAKSELISLGWTGARLRPLSQAPISQASGNAAGGQTRIALELSDLVDFLQCARYPTGIQRVQLALAQAFAETHEEDQAALVYFDQIKCVWKNIERSQLWDIVDLVHNDSRPDDARRVIASRIRAELVAAEDFEFAPGCALVNPGTSWGYLNYFLAIRDAKRRYSIKYIPLVHDCIPLLFREYCNPALVHDYINWISGVLTHADLILTNSDNTKADLHKAAADLEMTPRPSATIHLNGQFRATPQDEAGQDRAALAVLADNNLDIEDFVLFVSTIEPRKNHGLALTAWSKMLKSRSGRRIPRLVCVGASGWMNDDFHQRLARDAALRERVAVLNNVSDHVLSLLYRRCLCTLYPSQYEGWGLPISEALAHGKAPLVSNVSSHPEAGGDLAVYFDLDSAADFQEKLEKLIFDKAYRRSVERKIAGGSPLRPWSEIGQQIFGVVEKLEAPSAKAQPAPGDRLHGPAPIACGVYYSFARNTASALRDIHHAGDIFRDGLNWHAPERFGCWINRRSADVLFSLADAPGNEFVIYLHWTGSSNIDNETVLSLPGSTWSKQISLPQGQVRWDAIPVRFAGGSKREVRIRLTSRWMDDFGAATEGRDRRQSSVGVKGVYVAAASDLAQRLAISEAIVRGELEHLARRFPDVAVL